MAAARAETLDLRVTPEQKDLLRRASAARGQNMTAFVLAAALPLAEETLRAQTRIVLTETAWLEFVRMAYSPTPPTAIAKREAGEFLAEMALPTGR